MRSFKKLCAAVALGMASLGASAATLYQLGGETSSYRFSGSFTVGDVDLSGFAPLLDFNLTLLDKALGSSELYTLAHADDGAAIGAWYEGTTFLGVDYQDLDSDPGLDPLLSATLTPLVFVAGFSSFDGPIFFVEPAGGAPELLVGPAPSDTTGTGGAPFINAVPLPGSLLLSLAALGLVALRRRA